MEPNNSREPNIQKLFQSLLNSKECQIWTKQEILNICNYSDEKNFKLQTYLDQLVKDGLIYSMTTFTDNKSSEISIYWIKNQLLNKTLLSNQKDQTFSSTNNSEEPLPKKRSSGQQQHQSISSIIKNAKSKTILLKSNNKTNLKYKSGGSFNGLKSSINIERKHPELKILMDQQYNLEKDIINMKNNIQKIQLAMSYEEKDEKNTIDELIKKWRSASQEAAELLHSKMPKRSSFLEYSGFSYSYGNWDEQHQQKEIDNLIQRLIESLRIITNRALYHTVISSPSSSNDNDVDDNKIAEYSSFSFRYLTFNELFPSITILLTSPRLNKSLKFKKFVNYVALLCTILLGEDIDDTVSDSLPQAFNDDYRLFKMTEIRNTLGIGDLWCGPGQFTKDKNDDNDCHYVFDYNDKELLDTKTKEDHNMKKAKEILKMQSYGAIGTNSDCLDNLVIPQNHLIIMLTYHTQAFLIVVRILEYGKGLVSGMQSLDETNCKIIMELFEELIKMTAFNVGNQAVASSIINLDALPTILSFVNINPSSVATDYDFGRIPLELLEIVVKFSRAVPFLLSSQTNELVLSLISNDNHLRSLWDPIATFHETANIQGIIDIIKHQKYYPECLRDHTVVNQLLISLRFLLAYTYTDGGINQILVARMDDFSGLDNGDSLLVFLLRLLNSASEILYDLSDFFVYTENNSLNDPNFSNFSNFKEEIENQDELKNTDTTNIK
ncbi:4558_t:CDS:2, partial [Entrophospora sp. SA101]